MEHNVKNINKKIANTAIYITNTAAITSYKHIYKKIKIYSEQVLF